MIKSNTNDEISDMVAAIKESHQHTSINKFGLKVIFIGMMAMERFPAADHK